MNIFTVISLCIKKKSLKPFGKWFFEHFISHIIVYPAVALVVILLANITQLSKEYLPESILKFFKDFLPESVLGLIQILSYALDHPYRIIVSAFFIGIVISFLKRTFIDLPKLREVVSSVGLFAFWNNGKDESEENWKDCVVKIDETVTDIRILGATGRCTFSEKYSPLHKCVEEFRGEIHVLLMNPKSNCIKDAAERVGEDPAVFKSEIMTSIQYCKELNARNGGKVFLKLYDNTPLWKIIIAGKFIRVQNYKHRIDHNHKVVDIEQSPAYGFYADKNHTSIYYPFFESFIDIWDKSNIVDLKLP